MIEAVQEWTASQGKTLMMKHLNGEHLSPKEAIIAKCADCSAGYMDGRKDCETPDCPLYAYMPYRKDKQAKQKVVKFARRRSVLGV